jgi:DNA-binding MarR family transcriptional regulator
VGLSLPAASRLVELLVKRGFIERRARSNDRRSVALTLTGRGRTAFNLAHEATQAALAERFAALPVHERALVSQAMEILARAFAPSAVPPEPEN